MKEYTADAMIENIPAVISIIDEWLEGLSCPTKAQMQIDLSVEEIFVNVAHYAYKPKTGMIRIVCNNPENDVSVEISFEDAGVPFDPLAKEDPDVTLSAEERPIGGLGIYMVKKSMDDVQYQYKDGKNIFTMRKNIVS